jgi:hypothetical protein
VNLSVENTAAASVEPTTAPRRNDSVHDRSNTTRAAAPVTSMVTRTPRELRREAGPMTGRTSRHSVVSPPSNKIAIKPTMPIERASSASSK